MTLFDTPTVNVRPSDPRTSHAAADIERGSIRDRVRAALEAHPDGLTDWEILAVLGEPERRKGTVTKRRQECGAVPALYAGSSDQVTRTTPFGCEAIVWQLPIHQEGS